MPKHFMKHLHHIIPRHMGGTDDASNLIELTVQEHAEAHLKLFEQYGKTEDLCAYYMLSGKNTDPEFIRARASLGGKAVSKKRKEFGIPWGFNVLDPDVAAKIRHETGKLQGKKNAISGHMKRIQKLGNAKENGSKGGKATIASGTGSFGNAEERLKSASKGGKIQGKRNAESGHLKRIALLPNKRNSGKIWITNGIVNIMILPTKTIPAGFRKGKSQKKNV